MTTVTPSNRSERCLFCQASANDTPLRPAIWRYGTDEPTGWRCVDSDACEARQTYRVPFEPVQKGKR